MSVFGFGVPDGLPAIVISFVASLWHPSSSNLAFNFVSIRVSSGIDLDGSRLVWVSFHYSNAHFLLVFISDFMFRTACVRKGARCPANTEIDAARSAATD